MYRSIASWAALSLACCSLTSAIEQRDSRKGLVEVAIGAQGAPSRRLTRREQSLEHRTTGRSTGGPMMRSQKRKIRAQNVDERVPQNGFRSADIAPGGGVRMRSSEFPNEGETDAGNAAPENLKRVQRRSITHPKSEPSVGRQSALAAKIDSKTSASAHGQDFLEEERRLVDYFRHWHKGSVLAALKMPPPPGSTRPAMKLIEGQKYELSCPGSASPGQGLDLIESAVGELVEHSVFRVSNGALQYLALQSQGQQNEIIHSDPPVCAHSELVEEASGKPGTGAGQEAHQDKEIEKGIYEENKHPNTASAEPELLDPATDPLVKDCVDLFKRTVYQNCKKVVDIQVLSAFVEVVDGMKVALRGIVTGGVKPTHHEPRCLFESGHKHVKLGEKGKDLLPEEKEGIRATLEMASPVCKAADHDGVNPEDKAADLFQQEHGMGALDQAKGYQHLRNEYPELELDVDVSGVTSIDFTRKYSRCFPQQGKGAVRNQGTCGSCWAFAATSAVMNSLCIKGVYHQRKASAVLSGSRRKEVSVQDVMSCGPGNMGCQGGHCYEADKQFKANGLQSRASAPYKCAAGNPLNHFESHNNCKKFPWGGRCSKRRNSAWTYGGGAAATGEQSMKRALVSGLGMYVSFDVYQNIMQWRGAQGRQIYTRGSGRKMGGHAVNCVGYGTAGRYNYWKLLNSWGTTWGDNGYWRMLRGRNVCGIERGAFAYKASVAGGGTSSPRRRTSSPRRRAGYPRRRGGVTCKDHKFRCSAWSYVGYCRSDPTYMRRYCAKSCRFCRALLVESGQAANESANLSASFEDSRSDADKEKEREDMIKKWFGSKEEMEKVWQQEMLENDGQDAEEDGKEEEAEIADNEEETEESKSPRRRTSSPRRRKSSPRRRTSSPRRRKSSPRRRGGTTSVKCKNQKFRCYAWSLVGYCRSDKKYMKKYCAKSCKFCKGKALLVESGHATNQSANHSASFEDSRSDADKEKEREDMIKKWFGSKEEMEKVWQQEMLENDGQDAEEDGKEEEEAEIADNEEETEESEPGHSDEDEQGVEESELETDGEDIQDASEAAEGDDAKIQ